MAHGLSAAILFGAVALLAGCVSTSEVVPIGDGRYMITGRASGGLNAEKIDTSQVSGSRRSLAVPRSVGHA
jgi:hypothetical protein